MQFTARLLKSVEQRPLADVFLIGTQHLDLNDDQVRDEIERIAPKLLPAVTRDTAAMLFPRLSTTNLVRMPLSRLLRYCSHRRSRVPLADALAYRIVK